MSWIKTDHVTSVISRNFRDIGNSVDMNGFYSFINKRNSKFGKKANKRKLLSIMASLKSSDIKKSFKCQVRI